MISNETKAKVLSPYIGKLFVNDINTIPRDHFKITYFTLDGIRNDGHLFTNTKAVLRPITALTDEEYYKISELCGGANMEYVYKLEHARIIIRQLYLNNVHCGLSMSITFQINDYLRSIGIDLPHYLLDGKTLHECGLCVYEEQEVCSNCGDRPASEDNKWCMACRMEG
jgi:hypothetical protein